MPVVVKIDPIDRDIALTIDSTLSPTAQSKYLAEYAKDALEKTEHKNASVLGRIPKHKTFVDGSEGVDEHSVRPNGVIVYEFELANDVLIFIGEQLQKHSPYLSGRYQRSHTLFADGQEVQLGGMIPPATEYVFLSTSDYATKIEHGSSKQSPNGVYELTANEAKRRFGNVVYIEFNYRSTVDAQKYVRIGSGGRDRAGRFKKKEGASKDRAHNESRRPSILVRIGGR